MSIQHEDPAGNPVDHPEILVDIRHLKKYFTVAKGLLHAVDDVSLIIPKGKTLGLVGESGCGKSTLGRVLIGLLDATEGQIFFKGEDSLQFNPQQRAEFRKQAQIVFQDPFSSLNPRMSVFRLIAEPLLINKACSGRAALDARVMELMDTVGLARRLSTSYPHELDGGRRQRIGIARALAMNPKFIVCDEPVSALDVSIQAQILNLMKEIQRAMGITYIFITHDLSVVNHFSDDIAVMYLGRLVEKAPSEALFVNPTHPYTKALLSAIPVPRIHNRPERVLLRGEITSPINPAPVCRFANRCNYVMDICNKVEPPLVEVQPSHFMACHLTTL